MKSDELWYRDADSWRRLAGWMRFFVELGRSMVEGEEPSRRLTVGVSVPTRSFAAVLAAAGMVLARASRDSGYADSAESHFEYLTSLPDGTSVTWHTPRAKKKVGRLAGVAEFEGQRVLMIQTSMKGGLREACHIRDCLGVQPVDEYIPLPKGETVGKPLGESVPLLATLIPSKNLFRFLSQSSIDCLILGVRRRLVLEATVGELGVAVTSRAELRGTINGILRLRDPNRPAETFRSVATADARDVAETPSAVIYDGPRPYLRWRHKWPRPSSLLILDRSEPRAMEAADVMNEEYLTKRISEWDSVPGELPDGIEMTAYVVEVAQ